MYMLLIGQIFLVVMLMERQIRTLHANAGFLQCFCSVVIEGQPLSPLSFVLVLFCMSYLV